ncbi:MAG: transcriptional repressor [Actinomycetota bacterium]|nr:transcriptional repressor [Actinomycetota bacterium]MDD5666585.1 transcriptional repressor [Actinomycetota bacterium]
MDLGRRLRSRGYRLTPQREAILGVLRENAGRPLSPEDIHAMAGKKQPGMGIATIYRTMDLFCELGIAFPVHLRGGYRFYEINLGKHHHHMECIACGKLELLEACVIDDIAELVRDGSDFLITSHCMSLFGYCRQCLEGGKEKEAAES